MGLFTKKPPCAICGGKVGFLLPMKIEDEYICDDCSLKIDMQDEIRNQLTLQGLREYLVYFDQCQSLRDSFVISQRIDFGLLDTKISFDLEHGWFCMGKRAEKTVFEGKHIKSFTIKEDSAMLFEGSSNGLFHYSSTVPERVSAMAPQISMYIAAKRISDDMHKRTNTENESTAIYRQRVDIIEPFRQFNVEIHLDHPYWSNICCDMPGPNFSNDYPDVSDYLYEYNRNIETMEELAHLLMQIAFPNVGENTVSGVYQSEVAAVTESVDAVDVISEIKRYKELLTEGIITEEEFNEKKKKLMGI